ncbi:hypothetical protein J2S63_000602 [Marmoricola bigeumensis]|uniref:Uncharacterized protein n=1 Tax=Nocardioides marmoribigeumensis TaxID=433649 RepID=A0ABU2BST0_9ACTN|nr:hypothetical protein [Nocardioides marmoribigeumensis]
MSGMLETTGPRARDPFHPEPQGIVLTDLVESFVGTPYAETTAVLTLMAELTTDEAVAETIRRELVHRHHPLPDWVASFGGAVADPQAWCLTHVLGDGDDYLVGAVLPSGDALSALVYVDHNLGSVVKDAFVVPAPLEDLALRTGTLLDDPDQSLTRTDPARARAVIEAAVDRGARTYPQPTSDSWPMCRPLVEWITELLPPGGHLEGREEWTAQETAAVAADFFASPFGRGVDGPDERHLLESVLWFCTDHAPGDPYRRSPVTVELLLADWFPRKVMADSDFLARLPRLVRAYTRYCHAHEGIRAEHTADTLASIDRWEPVYLEQVRAQPTTGLADLVERLMDSDHRGELHRSWARDQLAREVGGAAALAALDDVPLPDEPFDWIGIPETIRSVVQEILDRCDDGAESLLDVEHRTAMRRSWPGLPATSPRSSRARPRPCAQRRRWRGWWRPPTTLPAPGRRACRPRSCSTTSASSARCPTGPAS